MKTVGEPDAGNLQVRFDEGALRNGRALLYDYDVKKLILYFIKLKLITYLWS